MPESLLQMWTLYSRLEDGFQSINKGLIQLAGQYNVCKKLMKLKGVGPITSIRLKKQLGSGEHFSSGRQLAVCIGLTPKKHRSDKKVKLDSVVGNSGDKPLRSCLFLGARAMVAKLKNRRAKT